MRDQHKTSISGLERKQSKSLAPLLRFKDLPLIERVLGWGILHKRECLCLVIGTRLSRQYPLFPVHT